MIFSKSGGYFSGSCARPVLRNRLSPLTIMAEQHPSPPQPIRQRAVAPGAIRRLFPWSEGQAKLALALLVAIVVALIASAIIFGISLRVGE
jgi:hypothetical protein